MELDVYSETKFVVVLPSSTVFKSFVFDAPQQWHEKRKINTKTLHNANKEK